MAAIHTPPAAAEGMTDPTERRFRGSGKISDYEVMKEKLGEGTFGIVSKAKSKRTGNMVALKKILMHNEKEGFPITALREVKLLKMLSHPNILRLEEMAVERQPGDDKGKSGRKRATLYMVTPYMDHDLSGMLTNPDIRFTDAQIKCYMLQLLEGLRYLHDIADFGLARNYDGLVPQRGGGNGEAVRDYTSLVVTRWYRPPELLLTLKRYTPAIDMWGVGCVFGEMFERKPILEGRSDIDQCIKIFKLVGNPNDQTMPGWNELAGCEGQKVWDRSQGDIDHRFKRLGPDGLDLIKQLLCLDWRKRINAIDALQHPYFKVEPFPALPESLPRYNDSHELDARRRGNQEKQRALPPAPAGGTVGMGPDEWAAGPNGYQNGFGYADRRNHARDRGPATARPYDDRWGPAVPATGGRDPTWRHADRGPRPPVNGHGPPPRMLNEPSAVLVDTSARPSQSSGIVPRSNVDTYIPSYKGGTGYEGRENRDNRPLPRDGYDRSRHSSRDTGYRESDAPRYRDLDAPSGRPSARDAYRERQDFRRDDQRRTRSRSPERERRERLRNREREMYRR